MFFPFPNHDSLAGSCYDGGRSNGIISSWLAAREAIYRRVWGLPQHRAGGTSICGVCVAICRLCYGCFWSLFGLISYCLFDLNLLVCVVRHSNLDEQTCWFCYTCWVERVCTKMRSSINIKGTFALLASHSLLEEEEGNITRKFKTDTLLTCCKEWISRKKIKSSINVFSKQARKGVLS